MVKNIADFDTFKLLEMLPHSCNNWVIECGALDGISGSAGILFELKGLSALNIEPHPKSYLELCLRRPTAKNENTALGEENGSLDMIIPIDNEKVGLVSARTSFLLDGQYWEGYGVNELKREKVEVTTYSEITKKYVEDGTIDFFILDVEGFELSAIKGMSGSNNLPSHIFVETDKVALSEVA